MVSKYPNAIDGYSDIRVVRDSVEEVLARDHNDNRSAVVAIEQTLGIQPQGLYGTVVARLDQSDTDFGDHIDGTAHRHITNHIDYPGSSPKTFADGYAMVPSRLGSTLNEFVARLGAFTPAGATGGDKIGITPYVTEHSKYAFPGTSLRSHAVATGAFLDENATLLERTLDSFVVDGMGVSERDGGNTARVAAGHIVSDGRLLRYNGADLNLTALPVGTFYVVARISNGNVITEIEDSSLPFLDPLNPIVLLKKIVRSGGVWDPALSTDIRRFGMLMNNKNFFSIGNTPSGGVDGYGCDFISLKGAVDYLNAIAIAGKMIAPRKLVLVSNLEIPDDNELAINIELSDLEIDGCGKVITIVGGSTQPLFLVRANRTYIHDLTLATVITPSIPFADIADTSSLSGIKIVRCCMQTLLSGSAGNYFLRLGNAADAYNISDSLFTDNVVDVENGGIIYQSAAQYSQTLVTSHITGNHIFQTTISGPTPCSGIQASAECVVSDNLIHGGFGIGISIHAPVDTEGCNMEVSDNLITGTDRTNIYMSKGIAIYTAGPTGDAHGVLITDNTIKGVGVFGIDGYAGAAAGRQTIIANNLVDNSGIDILSGTDLLAGGIRVERAEVLIVGNKIVWMGYPIIRAALVMGNEIYGHGQPGGNGILCVPNGATAMVCNNYIYGLDCSDGGDYSAINVDGSNNSVISGNVIRNCIGPGSLSAGINMGPVPGVQATIVGNVVSHSTVSTGMAGISNVGSDSVVANNVLENQDSWAIEVTDFGPDPKTRISIVGNRAYNCKNAGIKALDATYCVITDNVLIIDDLGITTPGSGIEGFSSNCIVSGNLIQGYGCGGTYGIEGNVGSYQSAIVANNMVFNLRIDTQGAIQMIGGWRDVLVSGNVICNTKSTGINMEDSARSIVLGNLLLGTTDSSSGIVDVGQYSVVANNAILGYGNGGFNNKGISLMDAYSSAVIGNTIAAAPDLNWGILLDVYVGTVDNLISNNVLNGLAHCGIDLNADGYGRHIVANNIIIGTGQANGEPGINNLSTQSLAVGNNISLANGDGIRVIPGLLGYLLSMGSAVISNIVSDPDAYGINVEAVGGYARLDGYADLNGCLIAANHIGSAGHNYGGIYLGDSWRATITGNFVKNFGVGIWLEGFSQGCIDNTICGNNIQQDPDFRLLDWCTGILIDSGCTSNNVTGNFIFGSDVGIATLSKLTLMSSNNVVWYRHTGIDAYGQSELCIVSNLVGPAYPWTVFTPKDGIDLSDCILTLVVGNIAYGWFTGTSFVISTPQPPNGVVMSGNLGRGGGGAPSDGAGGAWPGGWIIDASCRWIL